MKRSMILLAAVFAMASTSVLAQNSATEKTDAANSKAVALTDAELDNITAGAFVGTGVFNNGNASIFRLTDDRFQCVNCQASPLPGGTAVILVLNPGHPTGFIRCAGPGCI